MRQPKRLTREQKECVSAHQLNPRNWMLVCVVGEDHIKIVSKEWSIKKVLLLNMNAGKIKIERKRGKRNVEL